VTLPSDQQHPLLPLSWHSARAERRDVRPFGVLDADHDSGHIMTMSESLPLAEVKAHRSELVGRVGSQHERVTVTVHGRPSAVLGRAELGRRDASSPRLSVSDDRYTLLISPTAHRAPSRGDRVRRARVHHRPLLDNPHRVGRRLRPPLQDRHSARRGTYREIYRIDDEHHRVTVVGIVNRSDACRYR
jgi:mRNA interferase RelE/StbE